MPILSPATDNCPSWNSRRVRMILETFFMTKSQRKNVGWPGLEPATRCFVFRIYNWVNTIKVQLILFLGSLKPPKGLTGTKCTYNLPVTDNCPTWISAREKIAVQTRASAQRGTNTPGRCHFLMYKYNLSLPMIQGKINGPWNIGHWPTYILQGRSLSHTDPLSQIQRFSIK